MQVSYRGVMMPVSEVVKLKELEKSGVVLTQTEVLHEVTKKDIAVSDIEPRGEDNGESDLEILRQQYKDKYGTDVSNRYKNDKERLTEKVNQVIEQPAVAE